MFVCVYVHAFHHHGVDSKFDAHSTKIIYIATLSKDAEALYVEKCSIHDSDVYHFVSVQSALHQRCLV